MRKILTVSSQIRQGIASNTKGTAFVVYEDVMDAKQACDKLNGFNFQNRYLVGMASSSRIACRHALTAHSTIPPTRQNDKSAKRPRRTTGQFRKPQTPAWYRLA
jgi:RNA recognition motif-containing protein